MKCCETFGSPTCKGGVADQCYCREDLRPKAVHWLSRYVEIRCTTNKADFSSAMAVYDGYCSRVNIGAAGPPAATSTGSSGGNGGGGGGGESLPTPTVRITQTVGIIENQTAKSGAYWMVGAGKRQYAQLALVILACLWSF
ncbi:hypothetical protein QBC43DRAFT_294467 [Cladorrhinum sp. PSN259]|nr:hypothetical protein QBC43DRAFT_294467 [Cladorrhinum sp. PSN259]